MESIRLIGAVVIAAAVIIAPPGLLSAQTDKADSQTVQVSGEQAAMTVVDSIIKTLGPLSILGWYLRYNAAVVLPEKDKQLVAAIASFSAEAAEARKAFTEEAEAARKAAKESLDAIMAEWRTHSELTTASIMEMVRNCAKRGV